MRLNLLVVLLPFFLSAQTAKRVLFIGNSYTYVNNLPQLLADLALSNGDSLVFDSYAPGGYTFGNHFGDAMSRAKIAAGKWTHVILQAQSQEPSFSPGQVAAQTLPFAIRLDSLVHAANPCAQTVFYETWGRKNGDAGNCPFFPPICTYTGMQNRLKSSYKLFSDTCKALMAPVGEAWRSSITFSPALELYQSDQSHPITEGSYLAAAVFYEVIFKRSVLTASFSAGLQTNVKTFLLQRAHQTVNDSLSTWNLGRFEPDASFSYLQAGASLSVTGQTQNFNHRWEFGDGAQSTQVTAVHQYTSAGTFTISHAVYDSCHSEIQKQVISISEVVGTDDQTSAIKKGGVIKLFSTELQLTETSADGMIRITDIQGVTVWQGSADQQIRTETWPNGMYIVMSNGKRSTFVQKVIKCEP